MRIVCPNCEAQYEVPDDVMPMDGRDVQCSNCGQGWFQEHPEARHDKPDSEDDAPASVPAPAAPTAVTKRPVPPPPVDFEPAPAPKPPAEGSGPARRKLDPSVAEVLREEAELETQARRSQRHEPLESQPDLGLEDADTGKRSQEMRDRVAKLRGEGGVPQDIDASLVDDGILESRRDRLPDIEQINSTLRSNSNRSPGTDPGQTHQIEVREARSSRLGFSLVLLLAAAAVLVYVFAQPLAEAVPQLEPTLQNYVEIVHNLRFWLSEQIGKALNWLDAAALASSQ